MKQFFIVALLFSFTACSSMRLRYEAEVDDAGAAKKFKYERSYEVGGGIPTLCVLSAIFLGGACWYYLVMPTVPDETRLRTDAEAELKKSNPTYTVKSFKTDKVSWKDEPVSTGLE